MEEARSELHSHISVTRTWWLLGQIPGDPLKRPSFEFEAGFGPGPCPDLSAEEENATRTLGAIALTTRAGYNVVQTKMNLAWKMATQMVGDENQRQEQHKTVHSYRH